MIRILSLVQTMIFASGVLITALPVQAARPGTSIFSQFYLLENELHCIDASAAPTMAQPHLWQAVLQQAITHCVKPDSLAVQLESLRYRLGRRGENPVLSDQSLWQVRMRYSIAYLFLYDYCPGHAVMNCLNTRGIAPRFSTHEHDDRKSSPTFILEQSVAGLQPPGLGLFTGPIL